MGGWGTVGRGVGSKEGLLETWHSERGWLPPGRPGSSSASRQRPEPDAVQASRPAVPQP